MKKKHRCLLNRFVALVAALLLCSSLCIPCFADFNSEFSLPSRSEFNKHPRQWYIVKSKGYVYFFPYSFTVSSSGVDVASGAPTSPFVADLVSTSSSSYSFYYLDALSPYYLLERFPVPIGFGYASIGFIPNASTLSAITAHSGGVRYFVGDSSDLPIGTQGHYDSPSKSGDVSGSIYRLPAFYKSTISNNTSWGMFSGPSTYITSSDYSAFHSLKEFYPLTFYAGDYEYTVPFSTSKIIYSNHLIYAASLYRSDYGSFLTSDSLFHALILRMSSSTFDSLYGSGYSSGSWFPSDEDLQKELVNQFGIDSGTLSDSKSSLDSWSTTSSVDSDVASGASGLLGGLFQNLGTFLFSVSLLCFGAVVLRMLIRKAVDG